MESKSLELQTTPGLVTEAARLWQKLFTAQKEIESRGAKLVSLKKINDEITILKKNVRKLLLSVTRAGE